MKGVYNCIRNITDDTISAYIIKIPYTELDTPMCTDFHKFSDDKVLDVMYKIHEQESAEWYSKVYGE